MVGFCEHNSESSDSIKAGGFVVQMRNYQLITENRTMYLVILYLRVSRTYIPTMTNGYVARNGTNHFTILFICQTLTSAPSYKLPLAFVGIYFCLFSCCTQNKKFKVTMKGPESDSYKWACLSVCPSCF
jgi:hypothetical protein